MSEEKVKEAIDYASGTSKLESDSLTHEEADQIFKDIMSGKSDDSFLYAAVQYVKKQKKDIKNGQNR